MLRGAKLSQERERDGMGRESAWERRNEAKRKEKETVIKVIKRDGKKLF